MYLPEIATSPQFTTVSDLLLCVADTADELGVEAERKLEEDGDSAGYADGWRERTRLIQALPRTLSAYKSEGGNVPKDVAKQAADWSWQASRYLQDDNMFGMLTLLMQQGVGRGEPNELERLAMQCRPIA